MTSRKYLLTSKTFITLITSVILCATLCSITLQYSKSNYDFDGYPHYDYLLEDYFYEEDGGAISAISDINYGGLYKVSFIRPDSTESYTMVDEEFIESANFNYGIRFLVRKELYDYFCYAVALLIVIIYICLYKFITRKVFKHN